MRTRALIANEAGAAIEAVTGATSRARTLLRARSLPILAVGVVLIGGAGAAGARAEIAAGPSSEAIGTCTIGVAERRATIEVRVASAADFCELMSQVLADTVFRSPVIVTPGWLWHYADSVPPCELRYRHTEYRMAIRNSTHGCRWLMRRVSGWNAETEPRNERD